MNASGVESSGGVRIGSLVVQRGVYADFVRAERYLARVPEAERVLQRLERSRHTVRIDGVQDGNDCFSPATQTIRWDPHSALRTTEGGGQSPALGLLHEAAHAEAYEQNPKGEQRRAHQPDRAYDDREERRVIRGVEARVARALGEAVRHDHAGTLYRVRAPDVMHVRARLVA